MNIAKLKPYIPWHRISYIKENESINIMSVGKRKIQKSKSKPKGIPIPAGTEQETGFTRAETEKVTGPVGFVIIDTEKGKRNKK